MYSMAMNGQPVVVADVVDGDDVLVPEGGGRAGLAGEAFAQFLVVDRQHLDRDGALEHRVPGEEEDPMPPWPMR